MTLSHEAIQPTGDQLLNYDQYIAYLQKLNTSARVRIERMGKSTEGRGLFAIVIAAESVITNLDYHRAIGFKLQQPQISHVKTDEWIQEPRPKQPEDIRFPTMILGHTFGHEAAHLEGLLKIADTLAWDDNETVQAILAKQIIIIYPLANPDGREKAVNNWKTNPYGEDSHAAGDHYGFYVNRDLLHLTSPEGEAVMKTFQKWHPMMLYDAHEDVFFLGVQTSAVCWVPAFGNAFGNDLPENMQAVIQQLSDAVVARWAQEGYEYLQADMFAYPMINQPDDQPHWFSQGTAITVGSSHGIPSIITESARTPGSQSWEGRLEQKYLAGIVMLETMNDIADETVGQIYENGEAAINNANGDAYIVHKAQPDPAAVSQLIDILLKQGVKVYAVDDAYIIPLAQPESYIANEIMESKLVGTPSAIGVTVHRLSYLSEKSRQLVAAANLTPVFETPIPQLLIAGDITDTLNLAIANTPDGIRLLNRLWQLNLPTFWLSDPLDIGDQILSAGTFIIQNLPYQALNVLAKGLSLHTVILPIETTIKAKPLRKPQIAIYLGQGVDRPDSVPKAEIWWAMEQLGFDFIPLSGTEVRDAQLKLADVLVVPDGDPSDIVNGWQIASRRNASGAWDSPGVPNGIGQEGLDAIRNFVQQGGGYVGIGSGGGLLAMADYAGLINLSILHSALGSGRVILRVDATNSPIAYGFDGYTDTSGSWHDKQFHAFYYTESLASKVGGPIFKTGEGATPVIYYQQLDHDPETHYVLYPDRFDESQKGVAIATASYGAGNVTVMGIRPGFRALWTHTFRLVTNAIFQQVAEPAQNITLF